MSRTASIVIIAVLIAGNVLTGSVVFQIALLALAVVLVVTLVMAILARNKLTVRAEVDRSGRGQDALCVMHLHNDSVLPILNIQGKLRVENTFTGLQKSRTVRASLLPKGSTSISVNVNDGHPGKMKVGLDKVRLCDALGLVSIPLKQEGSCNFTIMPSVHDVDVTYDLVESESFDNDVYSPYKKGADRSEVFQIREYEEGDNISQIHWKLSSKTDKLVVKDPSMPLDKRLAVVVDKSSANPVSLDSSDALAELAVSIGMSLIEDELSFRVIHNDVNTSQVFEREVQFEEDLAETIPQLLTSPITPGETCVELYERTYGALDASHVICVSCRGEEDYENKLGGNVVYVDARRPDYAEFYQNIEL